MEHNIALLGLGTVGQGVVELLKDDSYFRIRRALVRDLAKRRDVDLRGIELVTDAAKILEDVSLDIVVEVMGGYTPAREYIETALKGGKHVVTANKAVIAEYPKLAELAEMNRVHLRYEASVGGEIPIINFLRNCSARESIEEVRMIINGTTNYILTEMGRGMSYEKALGEAQRLGYAEADPKFDVDGLDAAQKLAIVASIGSGNWIDWKRIPTYGIAEITSKEVAEAAREGCKIKLIASLQRNGNGFELGVRPENIPIRESSLRVDGVTNAILIKYGNGEETYFKGAGAGRIPTAKSVVADLYSIIKSAH